MKKTLHSSLLVIFIILFLPITTYHPVFSKLTAIHAQTENQCTEQLNQAEAEYSLGHWDEAIKLIEQCLKKPDVSENERGKAYRLLGLVYIAIQLEKEANDAVKNLLIMVPNYKIDPAKDPPSLQKIIDNTAQTLNPIVTSIAPAKIKTGEKGFLLTVNGKNFVYGSVIKINGSNQSTSYISSNELKAEISAGEVLEETEYSVNVFSPILGGKTSNSEILIVEKSSKFPWTWIAVGGGAVVAAVVAVLTLGGKDDNGVEPTIIADPPGRP